MKYLLFLSSFWILIQCGTDENGSVEFDRSTVEQEALRVMNDWVMAWNTGDSLLMTEIHDQDLIYIWRGTIRDYEGFMEELRLYILPAKQWEKGQDRVDDPVVQVIDEDAAVVTFHLRNSEAAKNSTDAGAFTLVVIRREEGWKILNIHESPMRTE